MRALTCGDTMTCGSQRWSSESARSQGVTAIVQFAWDTTRRLGNGKHNAERTWFSGFSVGYPVKSMMGEELNGSDVTERGLLGDRAYALVDRADGKVAMPRTPGSGRICSSSAQPLLPRRDPARRFQPSVSPCRMALPSRAIRAISTMSSRGCSTAR